MQTTTAPPAAGAQATPGVGGAAPVTSAAARPATRRKAEPRPVPVVSEDFAHLSVDGLRDYRKALTDEENKVSYWRRILQARLDVVVSGSNGKELDPRRLAPVLTSQRVGAGRSALVDVVPIDDIPPLPSLAELWERRVDEGDADARAAFAEDLRAAEVQLSAYRTALHKRIADATAELIARYRAQPTLCLTALPLPKQRRPSR